MTKYEYKYKIGDFVEYFNYSRFPKLKHTYGIILKIVEPTIVGHPGYYHWFSQIDLKIHRLYEVELKLL